MSGLALVSLFFLPVASRNIPRQSVATGNQPRKTGTVQYRLEWSWGKAKAIVDGKGWEVESNIGYRVRVTSGYLANHSAELNTCEPTTAPAQSWLNMMTLPAAYAGHTSSSLNPAAITKGYVESLATPVGIDFGKVELSGQRYCRAHYLIARADAAARALPTDTDMVGASLYVEGAYQKQVESVWTPFKIRTPMANGVVASLHELDVDRTNANVIIIRELGSFFDNVDFSSNDERRMAWQILKNVIASTKIEVQQDN